MKIIKLSQIRPDPDQPRQEFDPEHVTRLAESIKLMGVLQPLIVEEESKDKYLIIDGERRYRASKQAGLLEVPTEIVPSMTSKDRMSMRFHLQEQHQSWTVFDKARAIYFFIKEEGLTVGEASELLGMSRSNVSDWMTILSLSKRSQEKVLSRRISFAYLAKIVRLSKKYSEISDKSIETIENLLIDKLKTGGIMNCNGLSQLNSFMLLPGNTILKIKYLNTPSMTISNLLGETPEGQSIELDELCRKSKRLDLLLKRLYSNGTNKYLKSEQKGVIKDLEQEIIKFIK